MHHQRLASSFSNITKAYKSDWKPGAATRLVNCNNRTALCKRQWLGPVHKIPKMVHGYDGAINSLKDIAARLDMAGEGLPKAQKQLIQIHNRARKRAPRQDRTYHGTERRSASQPGTIESEELSTGTSPSNIGGGGNLLIIRGSRGFRGFRGFESSTEATRRLQDYR